MDGPTNKNWWPLCSEHLQRQIMAQNDQISKRNCLKSQPPEFSISRKQWLNEIGPKAENDGAAAPSPIFPYIRDLKRVLSVIMLLTYCSLRTKILYLIFMRNLTCHFATVGCRPVLRLWHVTPKDIGGKVRMFWKGHKIWKNLPPFIWHYLVTTNFKWKIFSNFVFVSKSLIFKNRALFSLSYQ